MRRSQFLAICLAFLRPRIFKRTWLVCLFPSPLIGDYASPKAENGPKSLHLEGLRLADATVRYFKLFGNDEMNSDSCRA